MNTAPLPYKTINSNTIINGDCLDILPRISAGGVDFILTDPPYLVGYKDAQAAASRTTITMPG